MAWTEIQPGRYTRRLGENEQFIKIIGDRAHAIGREHWSVTSKAAFRLAQPLEDDQTIQVCREAWIALRHRQPAIAAQAEDSTLTYEVPDETLLQEWANETFRTYEKGVLMDDLLANLKPARFVTAHLLLDSPAIVLHFPHWRTDGYGALLLVDEFLAQVASVVSEGVEKQVKRSWGDEADRLVPCVEDALQLPMEATPEIRDQARKYLATAALLHDTTGLAVLDTEASVPQGTRGVNLRFSSEETKRIQKALHEKDLTLEAAVQASCAAATYNEAATDAKEKPYTSTMRFSLRPFMPEPYDGPAYAAAICTGGYLDQVPASQSWAENAAHYTNQYRLGVSTGFLQSRRQYAKECLDALGRVPPPRPANSSEIDISSVGDASKLVSSQHKAKSGEVVVEVKDVSVGVETLTRQVYCFLWIYHGQLDLRLVYNEAFYDEAHIARVTGCIRKVLLGQLEEPAHQT